MCSFRAYKVDPIDLKWPPPGGPESELPFGREITSWADWKTVLTDGSVSRVVDEYGKTIAIPDFIAEVERTGMKGRRQQHDWEAAHHDPRSRYSTWLCPDGFSFSDREFS